MEKHGVEIGKYIHKNNAQKKYIDEKSLKFITYQIVCALAEAQKYMILHRDIKPNNILMDENFNLKLIDWGLNGPIYSEDIRTDNRSVQTLWYRCPEHLLKCVELLNNETIDMWSVGVIMVELLSNTIGVFSESSSISLLLKLVRIFGIPKDTKITNILVKHCGVGIIEANKTRLCSNFFEQLQTKYSISDSCISFIKQLLEWSPYDRLNPISALNHEFLSSFEKPYNIQLYCEKPLMQHLNFDKLVSYVITLDDIIRYNPTYFELRMSYVQKYQRISNYYKLTTQDFALMMLYTDKIMSLYDMKIYTTNIIACSVACIILMITVELQLPDKFFKKLFDDISLSSDKIKNCINVIIGILKFPLCYTSFVTYESALLCYHPSVLELFKTISLQIIISEKYIIYSSVQIFGSILHYMGNFKLSLKTDNSVSFYLKDKILQLLDIYPEHFELENINILDLLYCSEYDIVKC